MTYFILVLATAWLVYMRAIQQLNVVGGHYMAASLTPYAIACGEVTSVLFVVHTGWFAIPFVGTGGAIGVTCAMWSHNKIKQWWNR